MNTLAHSGRSWSVGPLRSMLLAGLVLAAPGWVGCSEHRISLKQFLASQHQPVTVQAAAATTQAASTQETPVTDRYMGPYTIGPGDVLGVTVTGVEQTGVIVPIQARVDREGDIDLPIVGKVHVGGLELQDAEKAVQAAYVPSVYRQASIHVELLKPQTVAVLVTGAVTQPGLVQLPRTQRNLLYAIAGAGGSSSIASGEVLLHRLRNPEQVIAYNLLKPEQLQQALTMEPLQNGDVVLVKAAQPNAIYIGGLVMAPHVQVNPPGTEMTVLQALASAGGLRTDVIPTELTLIRRMPDGKDVHVKLDPLRIQSGKDPNITLAPGDILWAPETLMTRAEDWFNRSIFVRGGFNFVATYDVVGLSYMNQTAARAASGTVSGGNLQNTVDPLGFLTRQQQLNQIQNQLPAPQ